MAAATSEDLRRRVVRAYRKGGLTYAQVAQRFCVGVASVSRWLRLERETGGVRPRPHGGGTPPKLDAEGLELLRQLADQRTDAYLRELADAYLQATGVQLAPCIVYRGLVRLGITRKKRHSMRASARRNA